MDDGRLAFTITDRRWPKHVEITAYFVVSEALANVSKHSGATRTEVRTHEHDGHLVVTATGDGRGGATPGDGLTGLRHRVEAVGGRLDIGGGPDRGTTLTARIPAHPRDGRP